MKQLQERFPKDLESVIKFFYLSNGFTFENFQKEMESQEYGAATFELNDLSIKFRIGKITPTKIGHFVTFWKRGEDGAIHPHDILDPFDFLVVFLGCGENFGQFVFPKDVLLTKGIISKEGKGGKLGMRLYSPWDKVESRQAKATQSWQKSYFLEMSADGGVDASRLGRLFNTSEQKTLDQEEYKRLEASYAAAEKDGAQFEILKEWRGVDDFQDLKAWKW